MLKYTFLWIISFCCVFAHSKNEKSHSKYTGSEQVVTVDLSVQTRKIKNIFSDMNFWDFRGDWTTRAINQSPNYFRKNYPFVKRIQFMTATGGNVNRSLFLYPEDRSTLNDYKFDELIAALRQVVRQGLKPEIITGNVPLKLSKNPVIGDFGVNVRPPFDYHLYYNYIKALADTLVKEFGIDEVKTWSWGVLTEYENKQWFITADSAATSTMYSYFKLYDFTVAALQDAIGASNLVVGAHSMTCSEGLWKEQKFIEHVAHGINFKTGKVGTQINFLTASFYTLSPGVDVPHTLSLPQSIDLLREKARAEGLTDLQFGIDEGRILQGPPDDSRPLGSRIVGLSFQGAADARMFRIMTDLKADWFSTWALSTSIIWCGVPLISTHIATLGYKMAGDTRVNMAVKGKPKDKKDEVNGLASINNNLDIVHLMIYNYNSDIHATSSESPKIVINHISSVDRKAVIVKKWIVDDTHGNFWPTWAADMNAAGINKEDFKWSKYSTNLPSNIATKSVKEFWESHEHKYKSLAALDSTITTVSIKNNKLTLYPILNHHGVVFYEILNVKKR